MLKEIKYFLFFSIIILFIFFSIKYYISDENKKKTFKNIYSIDKKISSLKGNIPLIPGDTDDIVKYLSNEDSSNKKKYSFWDLLKNDN